MVRHRCLTGCMARHGGMLWDLHAYTWQRTHGSGALPQNCSRALGRIALAGLVQVRWSLMAVGTHGSLEVSRGGWSGSRGEYALTWQAAGEAAPSSTRMGFSGVDTEFSEFVGLVSRGLQAHHTWRDDG